MRTLTLLTALLLAFLAQAQTMEKRADMDSTEDQPGDDEEEDMAVSFTGEERFAREAAGETPAPMLLGQDLKGDC